MRALGRAATPDRQHHYRSYPVASQIGDLLPKLHARNGAGAATKGAGGWNASFDPIRWRKIGRHGNGNAGNRVNPVLGEGVEIPTRGGGRPSNLIRTCGLMRSWKHGRGARRKLAHSAPLGASRPGLWIAQA